MAEVINPCQARFVPGRRTSDNIIIVQEVIRTLISRRGQTGYVALKLVFEKTYDRLEWHYIQETLEFFQLPHHFYHPHHEYDLLHSVPRALEWLSPPKSGLQSGFKTG